MSLAFNTGHLGLPSYEYIAWVDVMGTQAMMARSVNTSANFIAKLHCAALQAPKKTLRLYPVMDGVYCACNDQSEILEFLRSVFTQVGDEFANTAKEQHRFFIRGGLAFGPVYHGASINAQACAVLNANPVHRDALLMGMPVIQAYSGESSAPPFGLFVHESARAFAPVGQTPLPFSWWRWADQTNKNIWASLKALLPQHLAWCSANAGSIGYASDRIVVHSRMVGEYFA